MTNGKSIHAGGRGVIVVVHEMMIPEQGFSRIIEAPVTDGVFKHVRHGDANCNNMHDYTY